LQTCILTFIDPYSKNMEPLSPQSDSVEQTPYEPVISAPTNPLRPPSGTTQQHWVFKSYEVKCQETYAWYEGYIEDIVVEDGKKKLKVKFPEDWKEEQICSLEHVRPAVAPESYVDWVGSIGEDVEAQARSAPHEPYGWWSCKIRTARDSVYLIQFSGWGEMYDEVLGRNMLRPMNTNETLAKYQDELSSIRLDIPEELNSYAKNNPHKLVEYISRLKDIIHFHFDPETNTALIIGAKGKLRSAEILLNQNIALRIELQKLEMSVQNSRSALEDKVKQYKNSIVEKWTIQDRELIKYVFGKSGRNIKQAKALEGIIDIQVEDNDSEPATVTIYAELGQEEAVTKARDLLEIVIVTTPVPSSSIGAIIGARGQTIADIQSRAEVIRIKTWDKWLEERSGEEMEAGIPDDFCPKEDQNQEWENERIEYFAIIGRKQPCELARFLIKAQVQHRMDTERVRQQGRSIDAEIQKYDNKTGNGRGRRRTPNSRRGDLCFDYQRGQCTRGENCRFRHEDEQGGTPSEQQSQPRSNRRRGRGRGSGQGRGSGRGRGSEQNRPQAVEENE